MIFLYWFLKIILFIPFCIVCPTVMIGKKNIGKGKAIIAGNHQSNWDGIILSFLIVKRPYILAKKELFNSWFSRYFFSTCAAIPVDRKNVGLSTIKSALDALNHDERLLIFPEGTRKLTMEESEAMKNGCAMFALKSGAKVVPIYFTSKPRIFHFTKIIVGEPVDLSKYEGQKATKENIAEVGEIIRQAILELQRKEEERKALKKRKRKNDTLQSEN